MLRDQGLLALWQVRVKPHDGGSTLKLRACSAASIFPRRVLPISCCSSQRQGPHVVRPHSGSRAPGGQARPPLRRSTATVASAQGLERVRLVRAKRGGKTVAIKGNDTSFAAAAGPVDVTLALVRPGERAMCVSSSSTLRPSRRGGLATGR
jgi:hypothetical protein